jgi:hypothetical protein
MHRWITAACAALLLTALAPHAHASPLLPVRPLAGAAANDDAATPVHWRRCYRWHEPWHCRHYGWYRGRHYGWYRPHRFDWRYRWYGPHHHWRYD